MRSKAGMMVAPTQMGQQRFAEAEAVFSRCVALYDSAKDEAERAEMEAAGAGVKLFRYLGLILHIEKRVEEAVSRLACSVEDLDAIVYP